MVSDMRLDEVLDHLERATRAGQGEKNVAAPSALEIARAIASVERQIQALAQDVTSRGVLFTDDSSSLAHQRRVEREQRGLLLLLEQLRAVQDDADRTNVA